MEHWRKLAAERSAEIKRAQAIIDDLKREREAWLTASIAKAEEIELILAEEARVENGQLANTAYLAIKIAEAIERRRVFGEKR